MVRNAAHWCALLHAAVFSGQRQFQFFGHQFGILKKHLVEISQPVKQDTVFIFFLRLQILLHHWCKFSHVAPPYLS